MVAASAGRGPSKGRREHDAGADQSAAQLAAIVASSQDAIISKTLEGIITSWNAAAERLFGYRSAEMVGQSILKLIPPELQAEEDSILARLRRGERIDSYETVRMCKDGGRIDVSLTISPVRDGSGDIIGASKIVRDIGPARAAERVLRRSEERYRSLVEASGAIVLEFDGEGRWLGVQPAWHRYTGQAYEAARGHGWVGALHGDDVQRLESTVQAALVQRRPITAEVRIRHAASQSWRWHEVRAVPIADGNGVVREWIAACLDVHARKEAEEGLRTAARRKDEFLAVLAHELRNPLAPIANTLDALRIGGLDPATARELTGIAHRQLHHLVRLVDDLMEVSRITRDAIELRKEPMPLRTAVQAAVEISQPLIDERHHRLHVDIGPEPLVVHGDRTRLTQIVANLLNNAAKYTPDGGQLQLQLRREGEMAVIRVRDTGEGIPREMLGRVFEMFTRLDRPLERSLAGLGIGLSLVQRLAELHGGSVEARSEGPGRGSEFTVRLPLVEQAPAALEPAAGLAGQPLRRCKVLVADDNRDAARILSLVLRTLNQEVHIAHDGAEAVAKAREVRPDLMLLDLGMPQVSGYDAAQQIRREPWGEDIVLVALTGWGQEQDRQRTKAAGFDYHLVKPAGASMLQELLAEVGEKLPRGS